LRPVRGLGELRSDKANYDRPTADRYALGNHHYRRRRHGAAHLPERNHDANPRRYLQQPGRQCKFRSVPYWYFSFQQRTGVFCARRDTGIYLGWCECRDGPYWRRPRV
jgi:hypothetical protein